MIWEWYIPNDNWYRNIYLWILWSISIQINKIMIYLNTYLLTTLKTILWFGAATSSHMGDHPGL